MPTYTGPGHATIYTGTTPDNHGIIANTWYNKVSNMNTYCAVDFMANTIGSVSANGKMSPKNMLGTTITDELKREGIARELVNRIQNLRKEMGLEVQDKITISITSEDDIVKVALEDNRDYICRETQAKSLDQVESLENGQKLDLNGYEVFVVINK